MKKSPIRIIMAGLALGLSSMVLTPIVATQALAQSSSQSETQAPVILIVDQARLIASSKAGKAVNDQLATMQDQANAELQQVVEKLVKEQEDLRAQKDTMPEDQFLEAAKRLAVAQNNVPALREIKVRELSLSEQRAIQLISTEMRPILKEIVDARGATLLLDRSAVMYASQASDITDEVLVKLDEKLPTIKVERVKITARPQAAPQQNKN